jgi:hypothetical protein
MPRRLHRWVFGDFRPFGDYRPLPRLFAHNYGGDLRRSAGFVEEGPCSGAKRSEAERSGVSGVKADGLPVDLHGVGMALVALARAAIRAILLPTNGSTVERRRKHTTSSFYNDEENLLAFLAGCEHDARVMYHQATVFGVCTIYASGCEHDSRIMYHQASVDVCTIYASWHRFQSRRVSPGDSGWRLGAAREELQTRWPLLT